MKEMKTERKSEIKQKEMKIDWTIQMKEIEKLEEKIKENKIQAEKLSNPFLHIHPSFPLCNFNVEIINETLVQPPPFDISMVLNFHFVN